jgi:hypothetical protein
MALNLNSCGALCHYKLLLPLGLENLSDKLKKIKQVLFYQ